MSRDPAAATFRGRRINVSAGSDPIVISSLRLVRVTDLARDRDVKFLAGMVSEVT